MTTYVLLHPVQRRLGHRLMQMLRREIAHLREQRARRAAYRALAALDDRTLQDIGIPRQEIWSAVDAAFSARARAGEADQLPVGRGAAERRDQDHSLAA